MAIQFESHRNEFPAILDFEHDPEVLEYYDQPDSIKLTYADKSGRNTGCMHTPDFFVLRQSSAGWVECKPEDNLLELQKEMPNRYVRKLDGTWHCPPGIAYAGQFGLTYTLRSSLENSSELTRNLIFLDDYFRREYSPPAKKLIEKVQEAVRHEQGVSYNALLATVRDLTRDDLHYLISRGVIYTDLRSVLLADPLTVTLYSDLATAQSLAAAAKSIVPSVVEDAGPVELIPAAKLKIEGEEHIVVTVDDAMVSLLASSGQVKHHKRSDLEKLIFTGTARAVASPDARQRQLQAKILSAGPDDLRIAVNRWHSIQTFLTQSGCHRKPRKPKLRSHRRWLADFRAAEQHFGCGFVGLLSKKRPGRPGSRLGEGVPELVERYVLQGFETMPNPTIVHVYLQLRKECEQKGLIAPSLRTFSKCVRARPRYEQEKKTKGARGAYPWKKQYLFLDMTTPVHGDRPWEIGHIDHTQLDIELVCSRTGQKLGRPWFTLLIDAYSRRILAITLSYDDPSVEACMRVLRSCVKRHNRLPQIIVVDNGKDFNSTYFEALLATYMITKKSRPPARPRFGSVCERLFGAINTQFTHNLLGNTQLTKNVRMLTKSFNPKNHAVWTLEEIAQLLAEFCFEVYDVLAHPALGQSPREFYLRALEQSGQRRHTLIAYDALFHVLTLPTTRSGVAMVHPQKGVHLNYLDYWSDAFLNPKFERKNVPVRFDPWDASIAYAFVDHQWVQCVSNHAREFKHRSIRAIQAASAELLKGHSNHERKRSITARQLADFMAKVGEREDVLVQRARELASRNAYSLLQGETLPDQEPLPPNNVTLFPAPPSAPSITWEGTHDTPENRMCPVIEE